MKVIPTDEDVRAALNGWDDRLDFEAWVVQHDARVLGEFVDQLAAVVRA